MEYLLGLGLLFAGYMIGTLSAGLIMGTRRARYQMALRNDLNRLGAPGNWDYDPYMHGLYNGTALAYEQLTGENHIRSAPLQWQRDLELQRLKKEQLA